MVDDDVPLLLVALAHVTNRQPDDLVETWALELSDGVGEEAVEPPGTVLPAGVRGEVAELLDLAETLFEELATDSARRSGDYPGGADVRATAAGIYRQLRRLLDLSAE